MRGLGTLALHTLPVGKALEVFPENRGRTPRRRHQIRGAVKPPRDSHRAELQNDTRREALGEKKKIPAAAGGMRLQGYVARTQGTRAVRRQPRPAPVRGGGRRTTRGQDGGDSGERGRGGAPRTGYSGKKPEGASGRSREITTGAGDGVASRRVEGSWRHPDSAFLRHSGKQGLRAARQGQGAGPASSQPWQPLRGVRSPAGGRRPAPRRPERGPQTPKRLPLPHVVVSPADPNVAFRNGLLLR